MTDGPLARLLIVDDEANQMKALCNTLREQGYATTGCHSGSEALNVLRTASFDLLLTDLMMPELNGIGLLGRALQLDPTLVAIVMTGQGTIDTAVEAMKAGALDYILKPFKLSAILPVISRALAMRQLRLDKAALERRVRERTIELEAANHELEAFAHSVSHDLRAPLRHAESYLKIAVAEFGPQIPAEAQSLLNRSLESTRRMGQLIEDLLRLSRFSSYALAKERVNMTALVAQVLEESRKEQQERHLEVRVADLPDCIGDPSLLKQVFVNLLSNAFKFTRQREHAIVEIGSGREPEQLVYWVKDNGAGFDMRYAEKLFGVFERLHSNNEFEGTGIGLSLVRRIVERHGGRTWAEAVVDQGARFYFTVPDPGADSSAHGTGDSH